MQYWMAEPFEQVDWVHWVVQSVTSSQLDPELLPEPLLEVLPESLPLPEVSPELEPPPEVVPEPLPPEEPLLPVEGAPPHAAVHALQAVGSRPADAEVQLACVARALHAGDLAADGAYVPAGHTQSIAPLHSVSKAANCAEQSLRMQSTQALPPGRKSAARQASSIPLADGTPGPAPPGPQPRAAHSAAAKVAATMSPRSRMTRPCIRRVPRRPSLGSATEDDGTARAVRAASYPRRSRGTMGGRRPPRVMTPYRQASERARPKLAFGNPRRAAWSILGGLLLVAFTLTFLGLSWFTGGRFVGSGSWPAFFGVMLLLRARWGTMELQRDRGVLKVARRGPWPWRPQEVPLPEVQTVEVAANTLRQRRPDFLLWLVLSGDRKIPLLRGPTMEALESDRQAIAAFLEDNRLLWGGRVEEPAERVRVAGEDDAAPEDEAVEARGTRAL
jgi:hypothetical protein